MQGASEVATAQAPGTVRRRRLARTVSRARWGEYRGLLERALASGYRVVSLEHWIAGDRSPEPTLILRHDVDQHPRAVRPLLAVERDLGLNSTWYFRWRTADPRVIESVLASGGDVGLHYETLTRDVLRHGGEVTDARVEACRDSLRAEVDEFKRLFGPIRSVCPHGDSRAPGISNQILLKGVDPQGFGIEFDAHEALRKRDLGVWLTDRTTPDGRWSDGLNPADLIDVSRTPILCLTHPNNLASGAGLWLDRVAARVLPRPVPTGGRVITRTGSDDPPAARRHVPVPERSAFAPIAAALEREVRRYYYQRGEDLSSRSGLNTLLTNSWFAERRTDSLLAVLYRRSPLQELTALRVLDAGCGFGAVAAVLAGRGADVKAVDIKPDRFAVGEAVAREFALSVSFERGRMERIEAGVQEFDLIVLNNTLCYLVDQRARRLALGRLMTALRPGGWIVMRNPNRLFPVDQFTGLPLLATLPPGVADRVAGTLGRQRSRVRLLSFWGARRELRSAGFVNVCVDRPRSGLMNRLLTPIARYQHVVAQKPKDGTHG
jgi:2-polyprenyl-3-methyl-5-hydroxy-6-metoxy-1,4-benzoquinol methylase